MRNQLLLILAFIFVSLESYSQGCIMMRNISGFGQYSLTDNAFTESNWQLNIVGRYFKAYHDYKGTEDQKTPEKDQSIVKSYSTDITLSRLLDNGWSIDFSVPVSSNSRSATKEHGGLGTPRYTTSTFGLGDIRFIAYKWLLKPSVSQKINVQVGLGLKLPTGDYKYQDYFYKNDSTKVLAPVNGSIQLGDGGTGIVTEVNAFYFYNKIISLYGNFYYLSNPRDHNGVSTLTGRVSGPSKTELLVGNDVYSVPDVYSVRGGVNINFTKLAFSLGVRDEGVPVRDLVGGSYGLRRPGYNFSIEPGVIYKMNKISLYAYLPFIVSREIKQSVPDAQTQQITHVGTVGAGGSGDYQVFVGVLFKI